MTPYFELERMAGELTSYYKCILCGSLGLHLTFPEVLDKPPHDADFITDCNADNLWSIIGFLQQNGYTVFSWKDPIVEGFDREALNGRVYIRGVKYISGYSPAVIDVTYELICFPVEELYALTVLKNGIRILNREGYIFALGLCEKEKHLRERDRLLKIGKSAGEQCYNANQFSIW